MSECHAATPSLPSVHTLPSTPLSLLHSVVILDCSLSRLCLADVSWVSDQLATLSPTLPGDIIKRSFSRVNIYRKKFLLCKII